MRCGWAIVFAWSSRSSLSSLRFARQSVSRSMSGPWPSAARIRHRHCAAALSSPAVSQSSSCFAAYAMQRARAAAERSVRFGVEWMPSCVFKRRRMSERRDRRPRDPILITAMPLGGTRQEVFRKRFDLDDARIFDGACGSPPDRRLFSSSWQASRWSSEQLMVARGVRHTAGPLSVVLARSHFDRNTSGSWKSSTPKDPKCLGSCVSKLIGRWSRN